MTRVLIAAQATNKLGRSTDHRPPRPPAREPQPPRAGLIRRSLTALAHRRAERRATTVPAPAADQPAPEMAVAMKAER